MMLKRFLPYSAAIAVAFLPGLLRADIVVDSKAGLVASTCTTSLICTTVLGGTVAITEDPAWQQIPVTNPGPGHSSDTSAIWIGAVHSGYGDPTFVPQDLVGPAYEITSQTFTGSKLYLDVWADDSVDVYLVNTTLGTRSEISPVSTITQSGACSGQIVSCTPPTEGLFTNSLIAVDSYDLQFNVWQTGTATNTTDNPTGLLFTGNVSVPEPGSVSILLAMLVGVAGFAGILKKKLA
jgi:hypothetical protein